jgi:hypothetical protein
MIGRLKYTIAGWLLLSILIISTGVVFHTDLDGRYRPNCPACQLEHNPGLHTSAASLASAITSPDALYFISYASKAAVKQLFQTLELSPRSPPESS